MPEKTDISQQIKKYLDGKLDAGAMHEMERRAQDDPFLMDALEGFQNNPVDMNAGLSELNSRLQRRTEKVARIIPWRTISIAASILILLGLGLFWYSDHKPSKSIQKNVTIAPVLHVPKTAAPSAPAIGNDTAINSKVKGNAALLADNTKHKAKFHRLPAADAESVAIAPAPADKEPDAANSTDKVKDSTPLNEMIVMDYAAKKKADDVSRYKSADTTLQPLSKAYAAKVKIDTGFKVTRIKGTDIAKLDESQTGYNANATLTGMQSGDVIAYQQTARINNDISAASAHAYGSTFVGSPMRGYFAKRPATTGGVPPLNPVILHGKIVKGIVKASGEPVEYATVKIKGTTISTLTDSKGKFTLYAVPDSAIIQVLADDYLLKETKVSHRDMQLISLRLIINPENDAIIALNDGALVDYLQPRPSTGWYDLNTYLRQNAISPDGKAGVVKLSFTVNTDNSVSDFKVVQSLSTQADNTAIKLIKDGPAWYSASDNKAQTITISIKFHARGK